MVTLLTPTCDQPTGFGLCELYMERQTIWKTQPFQWLVIDDGVVPITPTLHQHYLRRERSPYDTGAQSLAKNLLLGLTQVTGEHLIIIEHDDWYHPTHLERLLWQLHQPGVYIAGDSAQRYYNVAQRKWRIYPNHGASLCQTGMHHSLIARFQRCIEECQQSDSYGIDGRLWSSISRRMWHIQKTLTCLGIKGLPGRPGLGVGHRPDKRWKEDPDCTQLQAWIGAEDTARYQSLQFRN